MKLTGLTLAVAALGFAPAALAQTAPAAQTAPQTSATPAPAAAVTDAEVDQFATAAIAVNKIQADASIAAADKGAKMAEAVTAAGLTADRFNAINQAMQSDPALNQRIQAAGAAKLNAAGPAAAAPTPTPGAQ